jgi:hypothetical protein
MSIVKNCRTCVHCHASHRADPWYDQCLLNGGRHTAVLLAYHPERCRWQGTEPRPAVNGWRRRLANWILGKESES